MKRQLILLLPLLGFLVLALVLYQGLFSDPRELDSALTGKAMPEFQLPDLLQPQRIVTQQQLPAGPFLLNIWATWCPTCRAEHAFLNELAEQGVVIVGVNYKDDAVAARQWLAQLGDPYQLNVLDAQGSLGLDLGVYGAPETFVISGQGTILYRHAGDLNAAVWQQIIAPLYQQQSQSSGAE